MATNPLQALIMHLLRMFIRVHKGACADFGLTLQTTNLKFPVVSRKVEKLKWHGLGLPISRNGTDRTGPRP